MKKFHVTMKSNVFSVKKSGQSCSCLSRMTLAIMQIFFVAFLLVFIVLWIVMLKISIVPRTFNGC